MNERRLANQLLAFVLIISLATGCGLGTTPPATSDPNQEFLNAINQVSGPVSPEQADQAEQDLVTHMREQSGARAAFGDQADAIFLKMDQDAAAALDEMVRRAAGAAPSSLKVSALITKTGSSGTTRASPPDTRNYWTKSMVGSFINLVGVPEIANLPRTDTGNVDGPITQRGDPNGTGDYYFFQPKFIGSRMEAIGRLRMANVTQFVGNQAYNESVEYTLSMELCPDAQGNVLVQFNFKSTVGQPGAGEQIAVASQATGHVTDEAKLDSWVDNTTYQGAVQRPAPAGMDPRFANMFFEFQERSTNTPGNNNSFTYDGAYTRESVALDYDFGTETASSLGLIKRFLIYSALQIAEKKWSSGYCVEIQVPEVGAGTKSVQPNSDTPFTANVHHKFEGVDLQVPVIATLSDGQVSVNPSGTKVPAPAAFTYKAPAENNKTATVNLVTRSKRGVATLDLKFTTGVPTWTGEGTYQKNATNSGIEVKYAYTFSITFHAMPGGTIEGTGTLKMVDWSQKGQGMVCKDSTITSLIYPPMQVTGTFAPAAADQPGKFQLHIDSQASTNTRYWICTAYGMTQQSPPFTDLGPTMGFDIAATDGAQANGVQDLSGYGNTGNATWELKIHQQATP